MKRHEGFKEHRFSKVTACVTIPFLVSLGQRFLGVNRLNGVIHLSFSSYPVLKPSALGCGKVTVMDSEFQRYN